MTYALTIYVTLGIPALLGTLLVVKRGLDVYQRVLELKDARSRVQVSESAQQHAGLMSHEAGEPVKPRSGVPQQGGEHPRAIADGCRQ